MPERFTFTQKDLADAFDRWIADCQTDSDGNLVDTKPGTGDEIAEILMGYLLKESV